MIQMAPHSNSLFNNTSRFLNSNNNNNNINNNTNNNFSNNTTIPTTTATTVIAANSLIKQQQVLPINHCNTQALVFQQTSQQQQQQQQQNYSDSYLYCDQQQQQYQNPREFSSNNINNIYTYNNQALLSPVSLSSTTNEYININNNIEEFEMDFNGLDMDWNQQQQQQQQQYQQQQQQQTQSYYMGSDMYYQQQQQHSDQEISYCQQSPMVYNNLQQQQQQQRTSHQLYSIKSEPIFHDDSTNTTEGDRYENESTTSSNKTRSKKSKDNTNEVRYGPVVVRPRRNPAPTLSSGRKSKYISLPMEEELKREIRRSRNRQAAEKCKRKRLEIEEKLNLNVRFLKDKHMTLINELEGLKNQKKQLELLLQSHNCNAIYNCRSQQQQQQQQQPPTYQNIQSITNTNTNNNSNTFEINDDDYNQTFNELFTQ